MAQGLDLERAEGSAAAAAGRGWPRAVLSGLCASLVGIGLARFGYTPLIPALIQEGWFSPAESAYLGAANLAGYLVGALLGRSMAALPARPVLRIMMILASAAFFACADPISFSWMFAWRFAAGLAGGVLMVLAATTVLPHVPAARWGVASGTIFMGVGIGACASGTLVPLLLRHGLVQTWLGLGVLAALLTAAAWSGWPASDRGVRTSSRPRRGATTVSGVRTLSLQYALNALGLVPHMVFLVDYVARGLHEGVATGARYWVLYGAGAMVGPLLTGHAADRIGFRRALQIAYVLQAVAVGLPVVSSSVPTLVVSSLLVGAFTPGIVTLVFGRVLELAAGDSAGARAGWSTATTSYALMQAAGAYAFSFMFARTGGGYTILFGTGACALALALVINLRSSR